MAHFCMAKNGMWRAQVAIRGMRKSATFRTKREAVAWAGATEIEFREVGEAKKSFMQKAGADVIGTVDPSEILGKHRTPLMNCSGIYFLFNGLEVVYVGQSKNVITRLANHAKNGRKFTHYFSIPCPEDELDKTEQYYIERFCPEQNKTPRFRNPKWNAF